MRRITPVCLGIALAALMLGGWGPAVPVRETILNPGESLTATNKNGTVTVSYVSPIKRRYVWNDGAKTVTMQPRPERFRGMLGIYDPAEVWFGINPSGVRLLVEEAERNFESYDAIYAQLHEGSADMDWVYTSDGLVLGFRRDPGRGNQITVDLLQFYLNGEKPAGLRGARDGQIRLISKGSLQAR